MASRLPLAHVYIEPSVVSSDGDTRAGRAVGIATPAAFGLAALSGMAYAVSFPPLAWSAAAWLALVPLLVACAALSPRRAIIAGMCWTVTMSVGVGWFLPAMLADYFGLPSAASWLAAVAIALGLHGVYVSAYAAWVAWLVQRRAANPVLLAGGWLVCEFARAHGVLGSPWALTAYSQVSSTRVIQVADLAGPYGIGMLVAGFNACVAALLVPALRGRRPLIGVATIAAALTAAFVYGEWRLAQSFDDGPALGVAVVQGGAPPAEKAERAARLARYVALTANGAAAQAGVIVWPEYAVEAYLDEPSITRDTVFRVAERARAELILGGPHYTPAASGTRYHNSVYLVRDGRLAGRYDKHQLVPFAEDDRLAWLRADNTNYTSGAGSFLLPATALNVGALLCIESMYPALVREAVRQGAELLINLSNDAWFGHSEPARHQFDIAVLRAVENRRYLVRAASTGFSAIIDPHGRTLAQSEFDTHEVLNAAVHASRARSPYQRWGDALAWMVIAAVVAASLRPLRNRTNNHHNRRSA